MRHPSHALHRGLRQLPYAKGSTRRHPEHGTGRHGAHDEKISTLRPTRGIPHPTRKRVSAPGQIHRSSSRSTRASGPNATIIERPMPTGLCRDLSDRDVNAIVAHLRTVKPIRNVTPPSVYNIPPPPAYGRRSKASRDVPKSDKLAYDAHLAGPAGHCIECHSPWKNAALTFGTIWAPAALNFTGPGRSALRLTSPLPTLMFVRIPTSRQ